MLICIKKTHTYTFSAFEQNLAQTQDHQNGAKSSFQNVGLKPILRGENGA